MYSTSEPTKFTVVRVLLVITNSIVWYCKALYGIGWQSVCAPVLLVIPAWMEAIGTCARTQSTLCCCASLYSWALHLGKMRWSKLSSMFFINSPCRLNIIGEVVNGCRRSMSNAGEDRCCQVLWPSFMSIGEPDEIFWPLKIKFTVCGIQFIKTGKKRREQSFDLPWLHSKSKLGHFAHFPKEPTFQVKAGTLHWHTGTRDWIWQHFNIVLSLSSSCTNNSVDYDNLIWYLLWYKLQRPLTWKGVF